MNLDEPSRVIGTITFAGRRFEVCVLATGLAALTEGLTHHDGLIVAVDRQGPLIVLRFGEFLRHCRFREVGKAARSKPSRPVSASTKNGKAEKRKQTGLGATSGHLEESRCERGTDGTSR